LESIVTLTAPAEARSVPIVRAVATGYAAGLPLGFDDLEDLRLAVSECCNRLLAAPSNGARLDLELSVSNATVTARLRLDGPPVAWPPGGDTAEWSWTLISQIAPSAHEELADGGPVIVVSWPLLPDAT
jgi:hypothetical protein